MEDSVTQSRFATTWACLYSALTCVSCVFSYMCRRIDCLRNTHLSCQVYCGVMANWLYWLYFEFTFIFNLLNCSTLFEKLWGSYVCFAGVEKRGGWCIYGVVVSLHFVLNCTLSLLTMTYCWRQECRRVMCTSLVRHIFSLSPLWRLFSVVFFFSRGCLCVDIRVSVCVL